MFRAKLLAPEFAPGPESLEVGLYERGGDSLGSNLAFPSGEFTLRKVLRGPRRRARGSSLSELTRPLKSAAVAE
jgi:hypothetical protein